MTRPIVLLVAVMMAGCNDKEAKQTPSWLWSRIEICGHTYIRYDRSITHDPDCTNHAPVVVTQECSRAHCDMVGPALHEPCNNIACSICRPNKWLGDGKIEYNDAAGEK